jgi:CheY-like chemotaxis protein
LITFSKGGEPLRKEISLAELLKDLCHYTLSGSNVQYKISAPEDLWPVFADQGQLKQVVHHLLKNAMEAMHEGGVIEIMAMNRTVTENEGLPFKDGNYVAWIVEDHGIGIPKENLSRIFDPYFTTKCLNSTKGMGLGLAICYSIIKRNDGLIRVVSEPGSGTAFTVYLPAAVSGDAVEANMQNIAVRKHPAKESSVCKGRVLVMDDQKIIRDLMMDMLDQLGYDVTVARDSNEAIVSYKSANEFERPFTVVILDVTVRGGMGGEFAIKKLLQIDPHVKAIAISGYTDDPVIHNYRKYGFLGALTKPFKRDELQSILETKI